MTELEKHTQRQFKCGVCFDDHSEDGVARLDRCEHCFCRDCIRGYVRSKLAENRYPILCPVCIIDDAKSDPGSALPCSIIGTHRYLIYAPVVTGVLVQQIGILEKEYDTWIELGLVEFSVLLHCRK
jgi:hypothetical protein